MSRKKWEALACKFIRGTKWGKRVERWSCSINTRKLNHEKQFMGQNAAIANIYHNLWEARFFNGKHKGKFGPLSEPTTYQKYKAKALAGPLKRLP